MMLVKACQYLLAMLHLFGASPENIADDESQEESPHGICAGLHYEPSSGALYDSANKVSPAQCDASKIYSYTSRTALVWTSLVGQLSNWLALPLDSWPWDEVAEVSFIYTQCGCECTPEGTCDELLVGCPVGFWIAALLQCATLWATAGTGPNAEIAARRCDIMDPLGQVFVATSLFFPFLRLIDIMTSGWPVFALLNKLGSLAARPESLSKSKDFVLNAS